MFGLTIEAFVIAFVIIGIVVYFKMSTYSERAEYAEDLSKEQLKSLVYSLAKSLKDSKEEDERLRQKIEDLQFSDSLQREQTKFLTANVNKTATTV
jgi:hypothetical protein|tara:strand:+ start:2454 stop:2741 length:288 start_codon:yes stop_codon:yes gene_type:complete